MRRLTAVVVALLAALAGWAQTSIRVEVHNIVEVSERFNVVFVVEGEHAPSDFEWAPGDGFTLVWGPQKGSSTSISMVNGKTTRSSQTSYTYILQAQRTGTFQLPPATARVKGDEIHSRSVQVEVVPGGSSRSGQVSGGQQQGSGSAASGREEAASSAADEVFMRLTLSRSQVVVGEPVTATLKIYHRTNLVGFDSAKFPDFKGFWSQETEAPSNIDFQREQVGGKIYSSAVLRRWVLIPQKAGALPIDPAEIVCLVNVRAQRRGSGSIFDEFFENDYVTTRRRVTTPATTLQVSALPAGAPAGFCGGVGEFSVSASLSKDSLKTHDAASLLVTVTGKGNVSLLEAPKINFPPDFEVYDVKSSAKTDKSGTQGSKTFEYPFIPRSPGDFVLAPVQLSYYDTGSHRYATVRTDSLRLSVLRSAGGAPVVDGGGNTLMVDRQGVKNLGEDIRFIRTRTQLGSGEEMLVGRPLYWILVLVMLLAAFLFWLAFRRAAARRADVASTRLRKASRVAMKRLRQAGDFLQKGLATAFYEELHRSLLGYVSDKLTMDLAEQSKENIAAALQERGVPEGLSTEFTDLLDACEFARYAPEAPHEAMNDHYQKALSVISAIDTSMSRRPSASGKGAALLLVSALLLLPLGAGAAESYPDSLWRVGVEAYTAGDYDAALAAWEDLRDTGLQSRELSYNLGNAYFKTGQNARAILWYERAVKADPSDADAAYNLAFARSLTQDRIDAVPEFFLEAWGRKMCWLLPSNVWAVLSLVLLAVTLGLALLFLLGPSRRSRKLGFFIGLATLLLTFLCWDFAQWQQSDARKTDAAILMRPVSAVKSSPSAESGKDLFILHEGTKLRILDSVSGYTKIGLSDGRQGWIATADLEVI